MLDDGMVAIDGKIWGTKLSGKHRRGDAAACSVPSKSVDRFSQTFTYDPLNRLTANTLGGVANQSWTLDSQGNWSSVTTNGTTQIRTANAQNQITSISGTSATPTYDSNGNMTTDQNGNTYVYNAWNQLVPVSNPSGQIIAQYTYNAMGFRVTESYPLGGNPDNGSNIVDIGTGSIVAGTTNYIYYDSQWKAIETRTNGTANTNVTSQMVWSSAYTNAAVLEDTYSAGVIQPNSRLYFLQDANWNTTAVMGLVSGSWQVTQRYVYSPYGTITIMNASWLPAGTTSVVNNLYQGMTLDPVTGLYYARNRNYSPTLGRWINQDPAGYINGANTYQFVMSDPVGNVDPVGLAEAWKPLGPVTVMEMTWTIDESVKGNGIWGVLFPTYVHQKVDFEVLVQSSITLEISVIGPMEPEGEPEEGKLLPPIQLTGSEYWSLPWADVLWPNRAHLAGLPCRKEIYFVQTGKNCEGKVETFYVRQPDIVGSGSLTLGNLGFDSAKAEQEVLQQAANPNLNICGEGTTDKPSGLAPLDSTAAIWAYYQPD